MVCSSYFFGFKPLSDRLRTEHSIKIGHAIDSNIWLIQGVINKHKDLSKQSASRTAIRNKQIAYLSGEISLKDLVAFSAPKLADAMLANQEIIGISRFDTKGELLFSVGEKLPEGLAKNCAIPKLDEVRQLNLLQFGDDGRLFYCSPIIASSFGRVGADILIIKDDAIKSIMDTSHSGSVGEMVVSLVNDNRILYWPSTETDSLARTVLEKYLKTGVKDNRHLIHSRLVTNNDWQLYMVINQERFFANISHQLFLLLTVVSGVAVLVFALTVAVLRPIIRSLLKEQQLIDVSIHDGLTGLYNRAYMEESLDRELARTRRYMRPLSILMFDIDHFKDINDTFGHLAGDEVLRNIALLIQSSARKQDLAARYGGEEFILILPETGQEVASVLAERLRAKVASSSAMTKAGKIEVTISIGVVTYDASMGEISKHQIVDAVDKALYASKEGGRNKVSVAVL